MSDLQCPATLLVLGSGGWPTDARFDDRSIAMVYAHSDRGEESKQLALHWSVPARTVTALTSTDDGMPVRGVLEGIADQHRGETIVVLPAAAVADLEIRIDADGWAVNKLTR